MTSTSKVASTSAFLALVLATLWLFWPSALGGGTTYVTTQGVSMEPRFHTGDLAILSQADTYSVGDIVAYHSDSLDTIVMHRIVSADSDGFVTQGDNNDWLDQDHPTEDEILGQLFLRVPKGGRALDALTSPWAVVVVLLAVVLVVGAARPVRERRARRRRTPSLSVASFSLTAADLQRLPDTVSMRVRARARQVALASGATALVAAISAGALFLVPADEDAGETVAVTERGQFAYTGSAERGTTYPTGVIETGDTVWVKLATGLTVSYASAVTAPGLADLTGALRLDVSIEAADGWSTYLDSGSVVPLQNGAATASVVVDAARATSVLERHYAEVGSSSGGATLRITPTTATSGTVQGTPFEADPPATLAFTLDGTSLRLSGEPETVLTTKTETVVTTDQVAPRTLEIAGLSLTLAAARGLGLLVLALALLVTAGAFWLSRSGRGDTADEFAVRHADRIVPVAAFQAAGTVIDVSDAESLHRVAERFDTVVLHHAGEDEDTFAVRDVDATYRFVVPGAAERRRGKPPVPAPSRTSAAHSYEPDLTTPLPRAGGFRGRLA